MAVYSIRTATREVLNAHSVPQEQETKKSGDETATENIFRNTDDVVKKERLNRKAEELLKYLYMATEQLRHRNLDCAVYLLNEDSANENDDLSECDDCYLEYDTYEVLRHKRKNYNRAKRNQTPFKEKKFLSFCRECQTPENIAFVGGKNNAIRVKYNRCVKQMNKDANR